ERPSFSRGLFNDRRAHPEREAIFVQPEITVDRLPHNYFSDTQSRRQASILGFDRYVSPFQYGDSTDHITPSIDKRSETLNSWWEAGNYMGEKHPLLMGILFGLPAKLALKLDYIIDPSHADGDYHFYNVPRSVAFLAGVCEGGRHKRKRWNIGTAINATIWTIAGAALFL
ncbi:MAG: hypothetical protein KGI73_00470, partial [Patescibacteria group bacterium]|nr:hypothetical protein [Patescibacteria group bacterium]